MKRLIQKVAILGSGVMGSRIACHFANIGCEVLLLDITPKEPNDAEKAKGLTLEAERFRQGVTFGRAGVKSVAKGWFSWTVGENGIY